MNVLSLLSGYSRNLHMKVIFNFHTPFHTRTPHCLTRPQAVRVTRRQTVTHPQAVTRPGTGNVHGCPLTTPNRPSRLPPSDPAIHRQADRHTTTTHPTPTTQGQPRARACEPHMQPSRREMWRQAWHMLGICMAWTDAPINDSTFLAVKNSSQLNILINRMILLHFSSDLSSGRRPMSKSDEKSEAPPLVVEI